MSFLVHIEKAATYRVVPEDRARGAGINVAFLLGDMRTGPSNGRVNIPLRAEGVATYVDGRLVEIVVPEGWRVEEWPQETEADDETVRQFLEGLE